MADLPFLAYVEQRPLLPPRLRRRRRRGQEVVLEPRTGDRVLEVDPPLCARGDRLSGCRRRLGGLRDETEILILRGWFPCVRRARREEQRHHENFRRTRHLA